MTEAWIDPVDRLVALGACEVVCPDTSAIARPEWLELRRAGVGGSDAAACLDASPWVSKLGLWYDKVDPAPDEDREVFVWGRRLEEPIARGFADETGEAILYAPVMLRSTRWPFMLANPDYFVIDGDSIEILECKNVDVSKAHEWADGPPLHYRIQGQHYLAVTGATRVFFAVLIGGRKFVWYQVLRDEELIATLVAAEEAFWSLVTLRRQPDVDASEATRDALRAHYARPTTEPIEATTEVLGLIASRSIAKHQADMAEEALRGIDNRLIAALGTAEAVTASGQVVATYKWTERSEHMVKASRFRQLRFPRPKETT